MDVRPQTADLEAIGLQRGDWCFIYSFSDSKLIIFFSPIRWMVSQILQLEYEGTSAWYSPDRTPRTKAKLTFLDRASFCYYFYILNLWSCSLSFLISVVGNAYIYVWQPNILYFLKMCLFFLFRAWFSFFKPNLFLHFLFFVFLNMMTWNPS